MARNRGTGDVDQALGLTLGLALCGECPGALPQWVDRDGDRNLDLRGKDGSDGKWSKDSEIKPRDTDCWFAWRVRFPGFKEFPDPSPNKGSLEETGDDKEGDDEEDEDETGVGMTGTGLLSRPATDGA